MEKLNTLPVVAVLKDCFVAAVFAENEDDPVSKHLMARLKMPVQEVQEWALLVARSSVKHCFFCAKPSRFGYGPIVKAQVLAGLQGLFCGCLEDVWSSVKFEEAAPVPEPVATAPLSAKQKAPPANKAPRPVRGKPRESTRRDVIAGWDLEAQTLPERVASGQTPRDQVLYENNCVDCSNTFGITASKVVSDFTKYGKHVECFRCLPCHRRRQEARRMTAREEVGPRRSKAAAPVKKAEAPEEGSLATLGQFLAAKTAVAS